MLYNTCHVRYKIYIIENKMLCYITYAMLYNICHVVISNVLCYVI